MIHRRDILSKIPEPAEVHVRLGNALREVRLLRALFRLAREAEELRRRRQAADQGAEKVVAS
jgi:hypothetical protein